MSYLDALKKGIENEKNRINSYIEYDIKKYILKWKIFIKNQKKKKILIKKKSIFLKIKYNWIIKLIIYRRIYKKISKSNYYMISIYWYNTKYISNIIKKKIFCEWRKNYISIQKYKYYFLKWKKYKFKSKYMWWFRKIIVKDISKINKKTYLQYFSSNNTNFINQENSNFRIVCHGLDHNHLENTVYHYKFKKYKWQYRWYIKKKLLNPYTQTDESEWGKYKWKKIYNDFHSDNRLRFYHLNTDYKLYKNKKCHIFEKARCAHEFAWKIQRCWKHCNYRLIKYILRSRNLLNSKNIYLNNKNSLLFLFFNLPDDMFRLIIKFLDINKLYL